MSIFSDRMRKLIDDVSASRILFQRSQDRYDAALWFLGVLEDYEKSGKLPNYEEIHDAIVYGEK